VGGGGHQEPVRKIMPPFCIVCQKWDVMHLRPGLFDKVSTLTGILIICLYL
jgi:hypothetical protein